MRLERCQVREQSDANYQHHQHDSQLEILIQSASQHLGCGQGQSLDEHHAVPEPVPRPAEYVIKVKHQDQM